MRDFRNPRGRDKNIATATEAELRLLNMHHSCPDHEDSDKFDDIRSMASQQYKQTVNEGPTGLATE